MRPMTILLLCTALAVAEDPPRFELVDGDFAHAGGGLPQGCTNARVTPGAERVVAVHEQKLVLVDPWREGDGKVVAEADLPLPATPIVCLSADGATLLTVSAEGPATSPTRTVLRVWETATLAVLWEPPEPHSPARWAHLLPEGDVVVELSVDGTLRAWDVGVASPEASTATMTDAWGWVAGDHVVIASTTQAAAWTLPDLRPAGGTENRGFGSVVGAFPGEDGPLLLVRDWEGNVLRSLDGRIERRLADPERKLVVQDASDVFADGEAVWLRCELWAGNDSRRELRRLDPRTGTTTTRVDLSDSVVATMSDVWAGKGEEMVLLSDTRVLRIGSGGLREQGLQESVTAVGFSPNGRLATLVDQSGTGIVVGFEGRAAKFVRRFAVEIAAECVSVDNGAERVIAAGNGKASHIHLADGKADRWEIRTWSRPACWGGERIVYVATETSEVVFREADGNEWRPGYRLKKPTFVARFSNDGKQVIVAEEEAGATWIDLEERRVVRRLALDRMPYTMGILTTGEAVIVGNRTRAYLYGQGKEAPKEVKIEDLVVPEVLAGRWLSCETGTLFDLSARATGGAPMTPAPRIGMNDCVLAAPTGDRLFVLSGGQCQLYVAEGR